MSDSRPRALVVGGGAFGVSTALALAVRRWHVQLLDPGPLPRPAASSTDRSKIVRMDYGRDRDYPVLAEEALAGWRSWNDMRGAPLYHETGFLLLAASPLAPGGFEYESRAVMRELGVPVETLSAAEVAARFPAWPEAAWQEAYYNPAAGWAESGAAVAWLLRRARAAGVEVRTGKAVAALERQGGRTTGVVLEEGERVDAEVVVVAAGAWTPVLVAELRDVMRAVAQPVFHLRPADPGPFQGGRFPPWGGDIANTGWYGIPATQDGLVKVAHHGTGLPVPWDALGAPPPVPPAFEARLRDFLAEKLPLLAEAPVAERRMCLYCDTFDGHFWIDRHPADDGLVVVAGGSGHGFKFCPVLGDVAADVVEGRTNPWAGRFAWRRAEHASTEHARSSVDPFSRD